MACHESTPDAQPSHSSWPLIDNTIRSLGGFARKHTF